MKIELTFDTENLNLHKFRESLGESVANIDYMSDMQLIVDWVEAQIKLGKEYYPIEGLELTTIIAEDGILSFKKIGKM